MIEEEEVRILLVCRRGLQKGVSWGSTKWYLGVAC